MRPILAGIETEYGLLIDGRGADSQVDDSQALVRSYPGECFVGWDYRYESPRADLRGFTVESLSFDPEDAKFDFGRRTMPGERIRADRILPNGARFYNDHGHPEYSTPECLTLAELADHDHAGQLAVLRAARRLEEQIDGRVKVYKNNTDFHGASYGTHEGYLMPRRLGFERIYKALLPMLVVRQVLTGAGKAGSESGPACSYQLSQRADFFVEPANVDTLYRRPIFNTRDEPHADPEKWIRVHVISGDACMIRACTALKVGLVKLALHLCEAGEPPLWRLKHPVSAFQAISRDESYRFPVELEGHSWTTAFDILESYFAAAEATLPLDKDMQWTITTSRQLMNDLNANPERFRRSVDWAAKRFLLEQYIEAENMSWRDPALRSFDLEYHNVDPEEGLHQALIEIGELEDDPDAESQTQRLNTPPIHTRALARGLAVAKFGNLLEKACWHSLTFRVGSSLVEVALPPNGIYPAHLSDAADVGTFIATLQEVKEWTETA